MMPAVYSKTNKQLKPVDRFIGANVVVDSEFFAVNGNIEVTFMELNLVDENSREDQGMLYHFPVDDNQFCVQLCYLRVDETTSQSALVCSITFLPPFFDQYPPETIMANQPFRFDETAEIQFSICAQTQELIKRLKQSNSFNPFIQALEQSELSIHLLRRALECISVPFTVCQVPACRFLAYESEREKIKEARLILEQNISHTFTIRELSRKVAMNECYLKKGFKSLVGKTIHEYQQELKIIKAKELLKQGVTVTYVADELGYSSISHFSAAFKRITGLKPCDLLN